MEEQNRLEDAACPDASDISEEPAMLDIAPSML
jgi:hypothetical protein